MKRSKRAGRVKVTADGTGVVSHAGVGMLRELADLTGLTARVSAVLADTYRGPWLHDPGRIFTDLAAAVADGTDCVSGIAGLADRRDQHAPAASITTAWRLVSQRVDAWHLAGIQAAQAGGVSMSEDEQNRLREIEALTVAEDPRFAAQLDLARAAGDAGSGGCVGGCWAWA